MFEIISVAAVVSYFLPLLFVLIKKLWSDRFFLLFALYWTVGGLVNTIDLLPEMPKSVYSNIVLVYNLLDVPLILAILYFTTGSILVRRFTAAAWVMAVVSEILGIVAKGFNFDALKYALGVGVVLVLVIVVWEIFRYLQKVEHSNRQNAKIFIYAALVFEYATFMLIYIFDYFVDSANNRDNYLIYYISSLVALFIASCGYLVFRKYEQRNAVTLNR